MKKTTRTIELTWEARTTSTYHRSCERVVAKTEVDNSAGDQPEAEYQGNPALAEENTTDQDDNR